MSDVKPGFAAYKQKKTQSILTMSFLLFWALHMIVALLYMQGQKTLGFHRKYLNLCFENKQKSYGFGKT